MRRVATFGTNHELGYTCCLPHSCNNSNTDMITANIYCKSFKIIVISYLLLVNIFIIDITVELPLDVTAIPQQYKINCNIAGKSVHKFNFYYDDTDLTSICNGQGNGFSCTTITKNGLKSDLTPSLLRRNLLTVTWEAENISSGNNGDHKIKCYAERNNFKRTSKYIIVKGNSSINKPYYIFILAPSSSPSNVTVVSICAINVTVNWTYDTNDADGYVVYYNNNISKVEGGDVKETTLDGLIPVTSYTITVRAYQDILGPPSIPLGIIALNYGEDNYDACFCIKTNFSLSGAHIVNKGSLWPNGSYFLFSNLEDNPISCVHSVEALHGGGWVLPNNNPCNSTTSPIQCTNVTTGGPTNITLQRVAEGFNDIELVYKCCLPYDCSDSKADIIIANIYSE